MLPANLLIVSMVIFLTSTVSMAPVEEKEPEEMEVEATEEEEVSEEEEDDDDSKSQAKIEGALGGQRTTTAAVVVVEVAGGSGVSSNIQHQSAPSGQSAGEGTHEGTAGSSAGSAASSAGSSGAAGSIGGSAGVSGSAALEISDVSTGLIHPAGAEHPAASSHTETNGSDGADSESSSNGQKLLNGGGGGGADSQTGDVGSFGGEVSHLDYTGSIEPSRHDFLFGLMDNTTLPIHLDSSAIGSGVTSVPLADQNMLDSPADPVTFDTAIDQPGPARTSLSSGPDQSLLSSLSGFSHSAGAAASSSSHSEALREQTGNGRQTLLTDTNAAVTGRLVSFSNLHTDLTGGTESVTSLHADLTDSGVGFRREVTESPSIMLHTESVDVTHTLNPVSGVQPHTDLVTMTADFSGTYTVAEDPTGSPLGSSLPAVTDHTQMAGSVTEQYNPSGQGPEGAENVELEDTC